MKLPPLQACPLLPLQLKPITFRAASGIEPLTEMGGAPARWRQRGDSRRPRWRQPILDQGRPNPVTPASVQRKGAEFEVPQLGAGGGVGVVLGLAVGAQHGCGATRAPQCGAADLQGGRDRRGSGVGLCWGWRLGGLGRAACASCRPVQGRPSGRRRRRVSFPAGLSLRAQVISRWALGGDAARAAARSPPPQTAPQLRPLYVQSAAPLRPPPGQRAGRRCGWSRRTAPGCHPFVGGGAARGGSEPHLVRMERCVPLGNGPSADECPTKGLATRPMPGPIRAPVSHPTPGNPSEPHGAVTAAALAKTLS